MPAAREQLPLRARSRPAQPSKITGDSLVTTKVFFLSVLFFNFDGDFQVFALNDVKFNGLVLMISHGNLVWWDSQDCVCFSLFPARMAVHLFSL